MAAAILASLVRSRSVIVSPNPSCTCSSSSSPSHYYYYVQLLHFSTRKPSANTSPLQFTEDYFVEKYKFSPQIASKLVSVSARVRNPQNPDLFLSFLQQTGFSTAHLERIVRHHTQLLSTSPEKSVNPKLKIFHDLGLSAAEVTHLIGHNITILLCKADRIIHSLDVYRRLLGSNVHVVKLLKRNGSLLYADPEKTVLPNIEFLKECGVQMDQINSCIYTCTHLFMISPDNLRRCVDKVDEMGVDRTSKMFIRAVWAVSYLSDEALKFKFKSLQDLGFSQDHILMLFRTAPQVMNLSTRKIKEVIDVLLETDKYDMSCILNCPVSLGYSLEKRYEPRLQVLKALERKSLIDKWPTLPTLCVITDKMFFKRFVAPNINEVGEDFIAKTSLSGKLEAANLRLSNNVELQ